MREDVGREDLGIASSTKGARNGNVCPFRPFLLYEEPMTTKAKLKALERVFACEIDGTLPLQSKAKIYDELESEGLVVRMGRTFGGQFPITVRGWGLTHLGRWTYCSSCDEISGE